MGKYENLQNDFNTLTQLIQNPQYKLPRKNASSHYDYRYYYTNETIEIVNELYREDVVEFGYSFDG